MTNTSFAVAFPMRILFLCFVTLIASVLSPAYCIGQTNEGASAYAGEAYGGKPQGIPGLIEAEFYDVAPGNKNGIAYSRHALPRPGRARSSGDCIGLGTIGADHIGTKGEKPKIGGVYVGWTSPGEWWNYTVDVKEAGTYAFGTHIAAGAKQARLSVTFTPLHAEGAVVSTGPLEIPTTAGFQPGVEVYHVWETLDRLAEIKLSAGLYLMTVRIEGKVAGLNIDSYSLTKK